MHVKLYVGSSSLVVPPFLEAVQAQKIDKEATNDKTTEQYKIKHISL